jgi:hypothetical protein
MSEPESPARTPVYTIVRDTAGVVVGDHAVQTNVHYHTAEPQERHHLNAATLLTVSPHVAVQDIRLMPHRGAVFLLGSASLKYLTPVLKLLLHIDEPRLVALLADVNSTRTPALISPLAQDAPWLEQLPTAVEAIAQEALRLKWEGNRAPKYLERVRSSTGAEGYVRRYPFQRYRDIPIYWQPGHGTSHTAGLIGERYDDEGGPAGLLGLPVEPLFVGRSPFSPNGSWQRFERGGIYASARGVHTVTGTLVDTYRATDGQRGYLGFPVAGRRKIAMGWVQKFEGGNIYEPDDGEAIAVRSAMIDELLSEWEFAPVSPESDAPASPQGTAGRMQRFQADDGDTAAVYESTHGAYAVPPEMYPFHDGLGGTASRLGFPTAPAELRLEDDVYYQTFEGGDIYMLPEQQPIAVCTEIFDLLAWTPGVLTRLGLPRSEEEPAGSDGADRIHYFEHGIVTRRNGEAAAWFRS